MDLEQIFLKNGQFTNKDGTHIPATVVLKKTFRIEGSVDELNQKFDDLLERHAPSQAKAYHISTLFTKPTYESADGKYTAGYIVDTTYLKTD